MRKQVCTRRQCPLPLALEGVVMPRELPHEGAIICVDGDPSKYFERRGLDEALLLSGGSRSVNPFNRLVGLARAELKAAGEQSDL
jgi:hypothetical protein